MRLLRGLGALLALLGGLAGIPAALVLLVGNPFPTRFSWSVLTRVLLEPDDGSVVIRLIAVIGWVAWLVFAVSLLAELVNIASGHRLRLRLPGLGGPQRLVAGLLLAVVTLVSLSPAAVLAGPVSEDPAATASPTRSPHAQAQRSDPVGPATAPDEGSGAARAAPRAVRTDHGMPAGTDGGADTAAGAESSVVRAGTGGHGAQGVTHVVQRGDDLWTLAVHYYGHGQDWRKIARANSHLLSGGPDRLQPGWRLDIPDPTSHTGAAPADSERDGSSVVVRPGDTLSSIADRVYGRTAAWQTLFEANRSQLDDPDEIQVGTRLVLPESRDSRRSSRDRADDGAATSSRAEMPAHGRPADADEAQRDATGTGSTTSAPRAGSAAQTQPSTSSASSAPSTPATSATPAESPTTSASPSASATPAAHPRRTEPPPGPAEQETAERVQSEETAGVLAVGGLLAAAVLAGLSLRRRVQLQTRPVGRRIAQPPAPAQVLETALGHRSTPLDLETLDLATRAIAVHCRDTGTPLPLLTLIKVGATRIELVLSGDTPAPPVGFRVSDRSWILSQDDAGYLASVPGIHQIPRPYPALVTLGRDAGDDLILVDLEMVRWLDLQASRPELTEAMLAAMTLELSLTPWADELTLTLVGCSPGLAEALGKHNVTQTDRVDGLLDRLERRAGVQRAYQEQETAARSRLDPDLADPWAPEIVLIAQELTGDQRRRLITVTTSEPRVTMAVVVAGPVSPAGAGSAGAGSGTVGDGWRLLGVDPDIGSSSPAAELEPLGLRLRPQHLPAQAAAAALDLVAATGSEETSAAPWWDHGEDQAQKAPPDNVSYLGRRFGGWGSESEDRSRGADVVTQEREGNGAAAHHPTLRLLGPVELVGATGPTPPRAAKQCLEYCGWLLEHPGTTAMAMASALVVAEGTRRSNMSRLRTWLGADRSGDPFLPDAYTGRIVLHPSVSSDWQRLQILTAAGVNKTSTDGLLAALELVRGAPLADAAPGQWHWAEELRTDMVSAVRDIGVEVTSRALLEHEVDLARWTASRALVAAPGDELLLGLRIRTEHQAGNVVETERLALQLAAQARSLGVDLDAETVTLLQEVMEGRVRARLA